MEIIRNEMIRYRKIIDDTLKKYIDINATYQENLLKSMEYSLFTGGKRLRPIMAIKTYEMFNNDIEKILPYASAVEMIHTYSLIHDDLPSMDNDSMRRGKPTNHVIFGEAMAILTGDALLNYAFEIMSEDIYMNTESLDEFKNKSRSIMEIGKYSGLQGMIGGQVVDLFSGHSTMDDKELYYMYRSKTAALFQAAIVSSAIIGKASDKEVEILREFSLNMGMAYQIQDDFIDREEDTQVNKTTYLEHFNKERSINDMIFYNERSIDLLKKLKGRDTVFLENLMNMLSNRER